MLCVLRTHPLTPLSDLTSCSSPKFCAREGAEFNCPTVIVLKLDSEMRGEINNLFLHYTGIAPPLFLWVWMGDGYEIKERESLH